MRRLAPVSHHRIEPNFPRKQIIGSLIKGVHPLLEKHPGLRIEIQDGKVRLVHLIRARLWTSNLDPADILSVTYRKLIAVAEESNVETELTPIAG